jgi:hypothetical protein
MGFWTTLVPHQPTGLTPHYIPQERTVDFRQLEILEYVIAFRN